MNNEKKHSITLQKPTFIKSAWNWLLNFEQAMNYDPQEYTYSRIDSLSKEVGEIKSKLDQIEISESRRIG